MSGLSPAGVARPAQSGVIEDPFVLFLGLFVGGLVAIYWGWGRYRRYTLVRDTPTARVRSMPVGRVELEGRARVADRALDAPFTDEACVFAEWHVEEYRYDPQDNDRDWVTIASGASATPFYLEDDTGRVLVRADDGADFDLTDDHETTIRVGGTETPPPAIRAFVTDQRDDWDLAAILDDPVGVLADAFDGDGRIGPTSNRRRYVQTILPVDEPVYVFGSASPLPVADVPDREAGANEDLLAVGADAASGLFIVSDRKGAALQERYSRLAPLAIVGGLAASAIGLYFLLDWYVLA